MSGFRIVSACHKAKVYGKPWVIARGRPEEETLYIACCSECHETCQVVPFIKEREDEKNMEVP